MACDTDAKTDTKRVHVGRIIFRKDCWLVQTLDSHVAGVVQLTEMWNHARAFSRPPAVLSKTRPLLVDAAHIHDMAKPSHFRLGYEDGSFGRPASWQYSFAGHRFGANHEHVYAHALAQMHHEYSVEGITKAMARMRLQSDIEIAEMALAFPLDLYALEMCDQIEATLARSALDGNDPEERVFMDFQFCKRGTLSYAIEPYPFDSKEIILDVAYISLDPPRLQWQVMEERDKNKRKKLLKELEEWVLSAIQTEPLQHLEVRLSQWIS